MRVPKIGSTPGEWVVESAREPGRQEAWRAIASHRNYGEAIATLEGLPPSTAAVRLVHVVAVVLPGRKASPQPDDFSPVACRERIAAREILDRAAVARIPSVAESAHADFFRPRGVEA